MKRKPSLIIGIPAFNEEKNIKRLIETLLKQTLTIAKIEKIIVISDASTDATNQKVRSIKNPKVSLLINRKRLGLNMSQNEIIKNSNSDLLVLLDGDVLPYNKDFLEKIITPLLTDSKIGLVAAVNNPIPQKAFIGKIIELSHTIKTEIVKNINNGSNVYTCFGRARAFSKKFYKELRWPDDVPEDSYSYFECLNRGFTFKLAKGAKILFQVPSNLSDHIKQSTRFMDGKLKLNKYFSNKVIDESYNLPLIRAISILLRFLVKHPIELIVYSMITVYTRFFSVRLNLEHSKYEPAVSTKVTYE